MIELFIDFYLILVLIGPFIIIGLISSWIWKRIRIGSDGKLFYLSRGFLIFEMYWDFENNSWVDSLNRNCWQSKAVAMSMRRFIRKNLIVDRRKWE